MRLHVHHAVSDGAGAFQLLEDFFRAYDNLSQGRDAAFDLREVDASRLALRHCFAYRSSLGRRRIHDIYVGLREAAKFVFRSPVPLAPSHAAAAVPRSEGSLRGTASVVLTRETISGLRRAAARRGATVHDILVRDAFIAMHAWNADFGRAPHGDDLLRLLSPCDLRCRGHEGLPAANVMAYAFYTRRASHCEDVDALTEGVIAESNYIRNENASMYFIRCLEVAHAMPGAIPRLSNASHCYATMVLSNLGDAWRFAQLRRRDGMVEAGELRLLSVRPYSPIRSGTHAAIVVCQYGQQATLGLSFNASRWDQDAGRGFLRLYQRQLEISAGSNLNSG